MNALEIQRKRTVTQIHGGPAQIESGKGERENLSTGQRRMTD